MSKVFVIPDVHLKPWMFEKASELIAKGSYDAIVMLYSNKVFQVVGHVQAFPGLEIDLAGIFEDEFD